MNRKRALLVGAGAVVLLGLGVGTAAVVLDQRRAQDAAARYDAALESRGDARADLVSAQRELAAAVTRAGPDLEVAETVIAAAADGFAAAPEKTALVDDVTRLTALERASAPAPPPLPPAGPRPDSVDALVARAAELEVDARDGEEAADRIADLVEQVTATGDEIPIDGQGLLDAMPEAAAGVIESNLGATTGTRLALLAVVPELDGLEWGEGAAEPIARYVASARLVVASQAAEDAQKAGPLYPARMEVEAFARSISGGVLLDFDWAPVVNGFGGGSYGGYSTWDPAGTSTITLSDSVADLWDENPAVASLVAHEVGHSITSKCLDLYRGPFGSQDELWATAWAIGMGYRENGNGESLYGTPSDELVALSTQCR